MLIKNFEKLINKLVERGRARLFFLFEFEFEFELNWIEFNWIEFYDETKPNQTKQKISRHYFVL